jgi:hypothetical protein
MDLSLEAYSQNTIVGSFELDLVHTGIKPKSDAQDQV